MKSPISQWLRSHQFTGPPQKSTGVSVSIIAVAVKAFNYCNTEALNCMCQLPIKLKPSILPLEILDSAITSVWQFLFPYLTGLRKNQEWVNKGTSRSIAMSDPSIPLLFLLFSSRVALSTVGGWEAAGAQHQDTSWESHPRTTDYAALASSKVKDPGDSGCQRSLS